jgi:Flp pilus assembly protein TadG
VDRISAEEGITLSLGELLKRRRRPRTDDESGVEMVEFGLVVVLLVALVYGLVFYGLLFGAHVTLTQAAADGARAGISYSTPASAEAAAETEASADVAWFGKGACSPSGTVLTCVATEAPCVSNVANTCLKVTVTYNSYSSHAVIPAVLGLGIFAPTNLVSTSTLQMTSISGNPS